MFSKKLFRIYLTASGCDIIAEREGAEVLLKDCTCQSACHNCLKHYRNQFAHGMLDRFAAIDLLDWGTQAKIPDVLSRKVQESYMRPLFHILERAGYEIRFELEGIFVSRGKKEREIIVYPAMWKEPFETGEIYVSDACLKYAKPYSVQKIMDSF